MQCSTYEEDGEMLWKTPVCSHIRPMGCSEGVVDRPTQLICVSDIYLSAHKFKRHNRKIC